MTTFRYVDPAIIQRAAQRGDHVYPHASYQPIPEALTQPSIAPWSFILHTMGGTRSATPTQLRTFINSQGQNGEPHLIYGYSELIQIVPFNIRADNNAQANAWYQGGQRVGAVSVETQDNGTANDPGIAKAPWNDFQVEHLAGTAAFLNLRYGIPLWRCPEWTSRGVDGHRAHEEWSIYVGKSCPGNARWNQIPHILNLAAEIVAWTPDPPEDDMLVIRFDGYADQFLCIPIDSPSARQKMDIPDGQPPVVVAPAKLYDGTTGNPEDWLPYELSPL